MTFLSVLLNVLIFNVFIIEIIEFLIYYSFYIHCIFTLFLLFQFLLYCYFNLLSDTPVVDTWAGGIYYLISFTIN